MWGMERVRSSSWAVVVCEEDIVVVRWKREGRSLSVGGCQIREYRV